MLVDDSKQRLDLAVSSAGEHATIKAIFIESQAGRAILVTSHVTVGRDIIHSHPDSDGAVLGATSFTDLLIFARSVQDLEGVECSSISAQP